MNNETNQVIKCFNCKKKFELGKDYSLSIPKVPGSPYKKQEYLFSWDEIPGNDIIRLLEFLTQKYSTDLIKTGVKFEKIDNDMTIRITTGKNILLLKLNDDKSNVNIEIDDGKTDAFIAKKENNKLNIYKSKWHMMSYIKECPFCGKENEIWRKEVVEDGQ